MDILYREIRKALIKHVPKTEHESVKKILIERIDTFIEEVVKRLPESLITIEKCGFYFAVYKEGLEALLQQTNPFIPIRLSIHDINEIVDLLGDLPIEEYCKFGVVFLNDCNAILTTWCRNKITEHRYKTIYTKFEPHDWITKINDADDPKKSLDPTIITIMNNIRIVTALGL